MGKLKMTLIIVSLIFDFLLIVFCLVHLYHKIAEKIKRKKEKEEQRKWWREKGETEFNKFLSSQKR